MKLNYPLPAMHSSDAVDKVLDALNKINGIVITLKTTSFSKRELEIEINDVYPGSGKEITHNDVLTLGIAIGTILTSNLL